MLIRISICSRPCLCEETTPSDAGNHGIRHTASPLRRRPPFKMILCQGAMLAAVQYAPGNKKSRSTRRLYCGSHLIQVCSPSMRSAAHTRFFPLLFQNSTAHAARTASIKVISISEFLLKIIYPADVPCVFLACAAWLRPVSSEFPKQPLQGP